MMMAFGLDNYFAQLALVTGAETAGTEGSQEATKADCVMEMEKWRDSLPYEEQERLFAVIENMMVGIIPEMSDIILLGNMLMVHHIDEIEQATVAG